MGGGVTGRRGESAEDTLVHYGFRKPTHILSKLPYTQQQMLILLVDCMELPDIQNQNTVLGLPPYSSGIVLLYLHSLD